MPNYTVVFDAKHTPESYVPPVGVTGGIVGEIDTGLLALYRVPKPCIKAFESSIAICPTAKQYGDLATGKLRDTVAGL
jgi:hypothetical protein